jgi:hypothetical protein
MIKPTKQSFIAIIPLIAVILGIFMSLHFDPFYSRSSDPEFPYLINGLNCAQLNFNWIGHIDHPGTPFQVYNGIIIRITHFFAGYGNIAYDVFNRPEFYLNVISVSLFLLQAFLIYWIGYLGIKRNIATWQILFLQAGFLFNDVLIWLFCRVNPDRFFMITGLIFILVYLTHGYENRSPRKFAFWSGTVMALGLATKFNFLPLLVLPLLFIDTNKNRLIYASSGIVSFFIFILPIIDKFAEYRKFILSIFTHDGLYGSGESKIMNSQKMLGSLIEIFKLNPELFVLIIALLALTFIAFRRRKDFNTGFYYFFAGFLFILALQMVMVSKHFKNYYLAPSFVMYGFMFFMISVFLSQVIKNQLRLIIVSCSLPALFLISTAYKVKRDDPEISKLIQQRVKIQEFVDKSVSKDDCWFVEPTWESGPYQENALVYGLSYCGHRTEYLSELMAVNPNIICFEGEDKPISQWRCGPAKLDSILTTGKNIFILSTPGRQASTLLRMCETTANQNNMRLVVNSVYSDNEAKSEIFRVRATNLSGGQPNHYISHTDRQRLINDCIQAIKNTPDWLEKVKEKAVTRGIQLDSMILLDATYMVDIKK